MATERHIMTFFMRRGWPAAPHDAKKPRRFRRGLIAAKLLCSKDKLAILRLVVQLLRVLTIGELLLALQDGLQNLSRRGDFSAIV